MGVAASPIGERRQVLAATSTTCTSNNTSIAIEGSFNGSNTFAQGLTAPSGHLVDSIELYVEHQEASSFTVRIMTGVSGPTSVAQTVIKTISPSSAGSSEWISINVTPFVPENQKFWVSFADGQIDNLSVFSRISLGGCFGNPYSGGQLHFMNQGTWDSSLDANFADRDGMIRFVTSAPTTTTIASATTVSIAPSSGVTTTIASATNVTSAPSTNTSTLPAGSASQSSQGSVTTTTKNDRTTPSSSSRPQVTSEQIPEGEVVEEQSQTLESQSSVASLPTVVNVANTSESGSTMQWIIALFIFALVGGGTIYTFTQKRR